MRRPDIWMLLGLIGLCLLVGAAGAAVTAPAVRGWYLALHRPAGTPPDWLFGPVWTTLYVMMGVSAWLVWRRGDSAVGAVRLFLWQLLANGIWPMIFFGLHSLAGSLVLMLVLLGLVSATLWRFWRIQRLAGWLLLPYLAWLCYATYLNAGFWWLNRVSA